MQKKLIVVLIMMSACVLGITGLQLYWNYQNYKTTVHNFKKNSNAALIKAVDLEMDLRHENISLLVKKWLTDTSFITITCNTNNRDSNTVFTMRDTHPYFKDSKPVSIGISSYKEKVKKITAQAKLVFVNHFTKNIVKGDLKKGIIYFYTPRLGDSLSKIYEESKANLNAISVIFRKELAKRDIYSSFKLNSTQKMHKDQFKTDMINTALRRPYEKEFIWATLENPNTYYLREMKWLIISSFLLITITLFCFYYTIKTLFSQKKLVAIKNQFISNMTHEINTPLSSIQVTAEALKKFNSDEETRNKYLDIILFQTKKLNGLAEEILENAKIETVDIKMDEEIDLPQLILNVIKELKLEDNLVFTNLLAKNITTIKGNKNHLSRSIGNVLENAFKYNSANTPTIEIKLTKTKTEINLTISDNGPGIADEFKDRIFEQFYRISTGNVHNIKGYGLGLSYVKKIIGQHRGTIQVLDNQPTGTIFSINLPG